VSKKAQQAKIGKVKSSDRLSIDVHATYQGYGDGLVPLLFQGDGIMFFTLPPQAAYELGLYLCEAADAVGRMKEGAW
jgi:hypothetical protein